MGLVSLWLLAVLAAADAPARVETAADTVTLRDGQVVLGQVVDPAPRGSLSLLVRRAWADAEVPEWSARWKVAETAALRRARTQRRDRLEAWRTDRAPRADRDDPILAWIDRELASLADPDAQAASVLMAVKLSKADVRSVVRRPKSSARMLRQAWLSGFHNPETMPLNDLEGALEGRGFSPSARTPVAVDGLLPIPSESDVQWSRRRAATEVCNDQGLKFIRTGSMLLPEPERGVPVGLGSAVSGLGELKRLLEDRPADPLAEALGQIAARGRTGAVVTRLEISPDLSTVRVESILWVRRAGRWGPAGSRVATVRTDQLHPRAGEPLADDPQVKGVFDLVESLGLGRIPEDAKRRSLNVGAATQSALGQVRSALLEDLGALALPVREAAGGTAPP